MYCEQHSEPEYDKQGDLTNLADVGVHGVIGDKRSRVQAFGGINALKGR